MLWHFDTITRKVTILYSLTHYLDLICGPTLTVKLLSVFINRLTVLFTASKPSLTLPSSHTSFFLLFSIVIYFSTYGALRIPLCACSQAGHDHAYLPPPALRKLRLMSEGQARIPSEPLAQETKPKNLTCLHSPRLLFLASSPSSYPLQCSVLSTVSICKHLAESV